MGERDAETALTVRKKTIPVGAELEEHERWLVLRREFDALPTRVRRPYDPQRFDPKAEALHEAIANSRAQIAASMVDIKGELDRYGEHAREQLDWKTWVQRHPWKAVGVGFALGLYFGIGGKPKPTPAQLLAEAIEEWERQNGRWGRGLR